MRLDGSCGGWWAQHAAPLRGRVLVTHLSSLTPLPNSCKSVQSVCIRVLFPLPPDPNPLLHPRHNHVNQRPQAIDIFADLIGPAAKSSRIVDGFYPAPRAHELRAVAFVLFALDFEHQLQSRAG